MAAVGLHRVTTAAWIDGGQVLDMRHPDNRENFVPLIPGSLFINNKINFRKSDKYALLIENARSVKDIRIKEKIKSDHAGNYEDELCDFDLSNNRLDRNPRGLCPFYSIGGVYFAKLLNQFLAGNWRSFAGNWRSFAGQNYFDSNGLFLSVLWSGPLLVIAILILISDWPFFYVNTLFSLCYLIVRWKRAELRHRARTAHSKEE
ncbi:transmembrane protein 18 [Striga asiatica]|uniref:Transmembrane protein 18 n=1 Tax=Striga asiatica TaxID=4170 RepID=A0A5A7QL17_STRAF|nr:transmembrane protein 18 [Striga asiatica]